MSEHSINIIERLKAWNEYQNIILQTPTPHMFLRRSVSQWQTLKK